MKAWGIALIILGALALLGSTIRGNGAAGGIVFITLGAYLIHCAKRKQKEKEEHEDWSNAGS
jgi:hypothetical protein